MLPLPRRLHGFRPAPGQIKSEYADFFVEEIPLYPTDGDGTHTYFLLEKAGLSTAQAIHDIARALNLRRHDVGFAGLKDAHAVTRQWMSVEHIDPAAIATLALPRLRILEVRRHRNKLRLGHLQGNRFVIKVRQTEPQRLSELQHALTLLERGGVPNYFGPQRFGYRGDTWATGRAILRGEIDQAIDLMLGCPADCDYGAIRTARELYGRGEYLAAARAWPAMFHTERRALKALAHSGGKRRRAFGSIDNVTRGFYVSAYQSYLFNRIVAARIDTGLDRLWDGDLAWIHASGRVFRVEDAAAEQPRADDFSISPSGPVFGYRMTEPSGQPAELEAAILADEGLRKVTFREAPLQVKGSRRPLRFQPNNSATRLGADERGAYLEATFQLPRGCYATTLLRELFAGPTIDAGATERNGVENHSA